jgi:hypothetical protein
MIIKHFSLYKLNFFEHFVSSNCFIVHFLYLHKENEPKETCSQPLAASLLVRQWRTTLCCSKKKGAAELATFSGSDSPHAMPSFFALLGCVKWHLTAFS